jgi:hypothetical protein
MQARGRKKQVKYLAGDTGYQITIYQHSTVINEIISL